MTQMNADIELAELILKYDRDKSNGNFLMLLKKLAVSQVWLPVNARVSEEDIEKFLNAKKGDVVSAGSEIHMRPDMLKNDEGTLFLPVFSASEAAPEDYRKCFSWVQIPFLECCQFVRRHSECKAVIVNPFVSNFVLPQELTNRMIGAAVKNHELKKDTQVSLLPFSPDSSHPLKVCAARFLSKYASVRKAYFACMLTGEEESYLFVVDAPGEEPQKMFADMNAVFENVHEDYRKLPVDFAMYPYLREQLEEVHCEPFYCMDSGKGLSL